VRFRGEPPDRAVETVGSPTLTFFSCWNRQAFGIAEAWPPLLRQSEGTVSHMLPLGNPRHRRSRQ
jgi:hypothetical protein